MQIKVKGKEEAVNVYRPKRKKVVNQMMSAETPQVGREHEMMLADECFSSLLSKNNAKHVCV